MNIVTLGGGTGSFTLLSGLKNYSCNISAIVSMADDGGSTGRLRDDLGVLPPGDVRQCLVALSDESNVLRELFNYRFGNGDLAGHTVGNILLSALEKINGSFIEGLEVAMKVLKIKGNVIPVTNDNVNLYVCLSDGVILNGQDEINHNFDIQKKGIRKIYLKPQAEANKLAVNAINKADIIVIGPGNHYCSVVPNLLAHGISQAIRNSKAKVIYVANLVNKKGHTDGFTVDDYVYSINSFIGEERVDYVLFNIQNPCSQLEKRYKEQGETLVACDLSNDRKRSFKIIQAKIINQKVFKYGKNDAVKEIRSYIRHDSDRLAKLVMYVAEMDRYKSLIKQIV